MQNDILDEILSVANQAAREAQEVQLDGWKNGTSVRAKGDPHDLVTAADVEAERRIASVIHERFPDHNFRGEEAGDAGRESDWVWIVDPIDGTTNFARGLAYFSVSIAAVYQGRTVVGLVANPVLGETFTAVEGRGAFLNGEKLHGPRAASFNEALMITGFYYDRGKNIAQTLSMIGRWYERGFMGLRRLGSAALDLCQLAAGRADGYFEIGLNAWDFAAGEFIARQAGVLVTDGEGRSLPHEKTTIIAGTPEVWRTLKEDWDIVRNSP
ncbi:MAG: inositol monophosphatase [Spirochaetales bacterium]|nr:inositol monophosphatase [Spirochaetales bacterium]